jgi:PBSX family phage terminase large subunit
MSYLEGKIAAAIEKSDKSPKPKPGVGTNSFTPLPWQLAPLRDKSSTVLLSGPSGAGRSMCAAQKMDAYLRKYPGSMGIMLRKKRQSMTNSTVLMFERTVLSRDSFVRHFSSKMRFEYQNGSILAYGGMADEEQKEAIRSIGQAGAIDIAWMEEASRFKEEDYNEILGRMRGQAAPWRQILLSTNPDGPYHWIRRRMILGREASVYEAGPLDNPYNPADYIDSLRKLTGVTRLRLLDGKWAQSEGVIWDWDDRIHAQSKSELLASTVRDTNISPVVDNDGILIPNPDVTQSIAVGVDWGFTGRGTMLVCGMDVKRDVRTIFEVSKSQRTIDWWIDKAQWVMETFSPDIFVCDPARPEFLQQFIEAGIPAIAANNDVLYGIERVTEKLAHEDGGEPSLFVYTDCLEEVDEVCHSKGFPTSLLEEIPGYVWAENKAGVQEKPKKVNDHSCDALRYVVTFLNDCDGMGIDFA